MQNYNLEVLNVLVVDDNPHMHSIVKAILNAMRIKNLIVIRHHVSGARVIKTVSIRPAFTVIH